MNGKPMEDISVSEQAVDVEAGSASGGTTRTNASTPWRIFLAVVILAVIAVLAYTFLQQSTVPAGSDLTSSAQPAQPADIGLADLQATAEANPGSAQAQFELGNAYAKEGNWGQAQAAYQQAIELDPNLQSAYANLGVVYYQLEKLDLAASQYQKALELDPDDGDVAYNLGALYLQQALMSGDQPDQALIERAVNQLQHAAELSPELAEPYFSLGVAYQVLGQTQQAVEAFETFLARDKAQDPRASQEAQRYLDMLRGQ